MSSSRRSESLNPRQRRRRRLNSSPDNHSDHLLTSSGCPYEMVRGNFAQSTTMAAPLDNPVAVGPSTRTRSRNDNLSLLVPLDQIVSMETISPASHRPASSDNILDGLSSADDSDDSDGPPAPTHQVYTPGHIPGSSIDVFGPLRSASRIPRDRLRWARLTEYSQFYSARREMNVKTENKLFPDIPSVLLVYKLNQNSETQNNDKSSMPYLPFVPVLSGSTSLNKQYIIEPTHRQRIDSASTIARTAQWIHNELPVEMFEAITKYLSRDDIKSMRLVNKEFERGVSHSLFDTVVVPFNTELYDMIEQERGVKKRDIKGKRRADDPINNFFDLEPGSLQWKNALDDKEGKVYQGHGIEVFEGFGSHIRRFGMSFEISENELRDPPQKTNLDQVESYFGSYDWPTSEYTRFETMAGLEATADETSQMKLAFSHLSKVQQLALSMDSGLGWMNGPDRSLRNHILQRPPQVFGCSHGIVDAQQQDRDRLWETLENAHRLANNLEDLKEGHLERVDLMSDLFETPPLSGTPYVDTDTWSTTPANATAGALTDDGGETETAPTTGVLFVQARSIDPRERALSNTDDEKPEDVPKKIARQAFTPSNLTLYQKEWLLEADWAQRAFLNSYMLAIIDNPTVFENISVLNLARVSSRLLPLFLRYDFWDALPNLKDVTLGVIPDWRTVERDEAGFVEAKDVEPSLAVDKAYCLLQDFIGPRESIKKLKFCWAAGGEHAEGIFARNHHILPAPVTVVARSTTILEHDDRMVSLPHVQELILSNCWISPIALENLTVKLQKASLEKLVFDSVSLTANPRNTLAVQQQQVAAFQNAAAGVAGLGGQVGNLATQFGAQVWQGPPNGVGVHQWAQMMLQNLTWTLQQQGMTMQQLPHVWTNHPMGMTLQQIVGLLTAVSAGGPGPVHAMAQPGILYHAPNQPQAPMPPQPLMPNLPANFGQNAQILAQMGQLGQPQAPPMHGNQMTQHNQPWYEGHRVGSWVNVMDKMSPGPRLDMYRPRDEFEPMPERRQTRLVTIEFISCGYVSLRGPHFDQNGIEAPVTPRMSRYFSRRQSLLTPAMLSSNDRNLGTIVQYMSEHEQEALRYAWGMRMGWLDEKLTEEPEYDGYLPGGTGRFSGVLTKDMPLGAAAYI